MNTEIAHYWIRRFDTEKFEKAWDTAYAALFEEEYY
jgi:hypothetical protein